MDLKLMHVFYAEYCTTCSSQTNDQCSACFERLPAPPNYKSKIAAANTEKKCVEATNLTPNQSLNFDRPSSTSFEVGEQCLKYGNCKFCPNFKCSLSPAN